MKPLLKLFLIVFAFAVSGIAFSGELDAADALYDKGKYKEALDIYLKHPDHAGVQNNIGMIYWKPGLRNEKEAFKWFKKSASQNNPTGVYHLALAYEKGIGVKQDYAAAMQQYKKAAELGVPSAMNNVGLMYKNGLGVKKDEREAANWYLKAANAGSTTGQCNVAGTMMHSKIVKTDYQKAKEMLEMCLEAEPNNECCLDRMAELYSMGMGVPENDKKARELREKAAALGSEVAMYNLGTNFDYGFGVKKDPKAAMDWYLKAAAKDHAKAMYRLYEVYEYGKLGQPIDKAKAAEWKARAEKAMKEQGLSRNKLTDNFRLMLED